MRYFNIFELRNPALEVDKKKFVDAGTQDENGLFDYYYAGTNFVFREGSEELYARIYEDTPERVSFFARASGGERRPFRGGIPYTDSFFRTAVQYFLDTEHVKVVEVLTSNESGPYEAVDLRRLLS
jgi:hypothetical protein